MVLCKQLVHPRVSEDNRSLTGWLLNFSRAVRTAEVSLIGWWPSKGLKWMTECWLVGCAPPLGLWGTAQSWLVVCCCHKHIGRLVIKLLVIRRATRVIRRLTGWLFIIPSALLGSSRLTGSMLFVQMALGASIWFFVGCWSSIGLLWTSVDWVVGFCPFT